MPYAADYQEIFESIAPDNVLAIVKRDFKSCLDSTGFYPSENLPDFTQRTLGDFMRLSTPSLSVRSDGGNTTDEGQFESGQIKSVLELAVEDVDPVDAYRKCIKYCRTLRAVIKTAKPSDFVVGSNLTIFSLVKEMTWRYSEVAKNANDGSWLKAVQMDLILKYNER